MDTQTVDEIFFMVPAILNIHERFLEELRRRLDSWDPMQKIGDAFVDVVSLYYHRICCFKRICVNLQCFSSSRGRSFWIRTHRSLTTGTGPRMLYAQLDKSVRHLHDSLRRWHANTRANCPSTIYLSNLYKSFQSK